jgi:N-acetylglucosamine-6-sulfatase
MTVKIFFVLSLLLASVASAAERPNILFIFSDDHALDAISAYGGPLKDIAPTPNLDRIADEGAVFTRSYCSNSICGPSRAAILTGKHSHINGYLDNGYFNKPYLKDVDFDFDGSQTTFPKLLREVGYQTALIGKWHLKTEPQGFDYWERLPGQGSYYNPDFIQQDGGEKQYEGYVTDIITDLTIDWLENGRDKDKPFVLMAQHKAPHRNWSPALRHTDLWDDVDIPEPDTLFDDYANRHPSLAKQDMSIEENFFYGWDMKFKGENPYPQYFGSYPNYEYRRMTEAQQEAWDASYEAENQALLAAIEAGEMSEKDVTRWKYQRYIKDYLRSIRSLDEGVGKVLDYLDESGLAENTIVIYSSDQGFYLGEHGWYDKRWMFEESFAMPFLIRWPGVVKPGTRNPALIQNIDYAPTFLEVAGVEIPETIQGRSLLPVLKSDGEIPQDWREGLYYFYSGEATHGVPAHDGVADQRYKLMYFPDDDSWNLFDLELDPKELDSVHDEPSYAAVMARMQDLYRELRDQYRMSSSTLPTHRLGAGWWKKRYQKTLEKVAERGSDYELVFIGDSITQGWEGAGKEVWNEFYGDRKALNLGYSGDRTEHVLWRLLNGELENVDPKAYVLMIGTNNTGHDLTPADETAEGVKLIVELLQDRSPESEILLLSVFPRGQQPEDKMRQRNDEINDIIRHYADDEQVRWLDLTDTFLDDQGILTKEVMPDALHPKQKGYRMWAEAMEPVLVELLR